MQRKHLFAAIGFAHVAQAERLNGRYSIKPSQHQHTIEDNHQKHRRRRQEWGDKMPNRFGGRTNIEQDVGSK